MVDLISFLTVVAFALLIAGILGHRLGGPTLQKVLLIGVGARVVGSTLRLEVMDRYYEGGDWKGYYAWGSMYAERLWSLDFSIFEPSGSWWGTQFVRWITGIVLAVVGPSMRAGFMVFSLFSFTGLVFIGFAFRNAVKPQFASYLTWLLLWPSLWFWPASIGKDALITLAVGLATFGYVGNGSRARMLPLIMGLLLTAAIRPHVATVLASAMASAEWLRREPRGRGSSRLRDLIVVAVAVGIAYLGLSFLSGGDVDLIDLEEQFEYRSTKTQQGGSEIATTTGIWVIPLAMINIFFRPFPWEANHIFMFLAALETWTFWFFAFRRRRALRQVLANWRSNRFFSFALPTVLSLALMYGAGFANLGIIARQRVIILPFLFIVFGLSSSNRETVNAAATTRRYSPNKPYALR